MKIKIFQSILFPIVLASFVFLFSCNSGQKNESSKETVSGDLVIFHAGSLSVPFKEIAEAFKQEYPEVTVVTESAGSVASARKITDLGRMCDIMGSADYKVIDEMLIPQYTDWNIKFASNEMTIVYHEGSKHSGEINQDNWMDILLKEDVAYGRANPDADPCGYRTVLTAQLAEKFYNREGFAEKLLHKDQNYIRPKEVDLLALLESNAIDYIFLYRSVAQQHGLKYILLPDEVNLKKPELADLYSTVSVDIAGKAPGEKITMTGIPMVYGVTMLKEAPNKPAAEAFMAFLLNKDKGMAMMEKNGQPSVIPSFTETYGKIPEAFKTFAKGE